MPISKYFGGHGKEVMQDMKNRYGARAEEVFYRTVNKRKKKASAFEAGMSHGRKAR